jgi:hypothetical protein
VSAARRDPPPSDAPGRARAKRSHIICMCDSIVAESPSVLIVKMRTNTTDTWKLVDAGEKLYELTESHAA